MMVILGIAVFFLFSSRRRHPRLTCVWSSDVCSSDLTWHDDISDGPVWATVTLKDGTVLEADPAMVAVTPPNFGQGLYGAVSMYDVVYNMNVEQGWVPKQEIPDFWEHIYP